MEFSLSRYVSSLMKSRGNRRLFLPFGVAAASMGLEQMHAVASPRAAAPPRRAQRGDLEVIHVSADDMIPLEQGQPAGSTSRGKKASIPTRQIWYTDLCYTYTGVICTVSCPDNMQAVNGGALELTNNAFLYRDSPAYYIDDWEIVFYSGDSQRASGRFYAVCMAR